MRWTLAAVIALLLLVGVGGVAVAHFRTAAKAAANVNQTPSSCTDAYRLLSLRPSQIAAAKPVCLVNALKFTGEVAGTVAEAYTVASDDVSATSACTVPKRWDGYPQALLAMVVGPKAYRLRISPAGSSEHQAVTINNLANVVELRAFADPNADWNQASGTVTLNSDGITGTIDAMLLRDVNGAKPVHVTGQWACGAPLLIQGFDASLPCSLFYALNHLATADVARMKAHACHVEDLTFSGDISAHLDHAITDTAFTLPPGNNGDGWCGAGGNEYDADLKFSIGDESFLLDLFPRSSSDSPIRPGQYAAGEGPFSANAVLWFGSADPTSHGLFITDLVSTDFWYGSGGAFTIANNMTSGTIDETFNGTLDHAGSTVHVTGRWRCAA
jgi:hypothetical protein